MPNPTRHGCSQLTTRRAGLSRWPSLPTTRVKRPSDVSFVRLVVMVYRLRWLCYGSGVG